MVIRRTARFNRELKAVFDFIAKDNPSRARDFRDRLIAKLQTISDSPLMYRKSASFLTMSALETLFLKAT